LIPLANSQPHGEALKVSNTLRYSIDRFLLKGRKKYVKLSFEK